MELNVLLETVAQQQGASVQPDGVTRSLRATRVGQLFTADWKAELVLAGMAYNVTVGGITGGANVALITGGGAGATTIDSDQPEMAIGTPTGYFHVPLSFEFAGQVDIDADVSEGNVILFADTVKTIPAPVIASATLETPVNLLGGGPAAISYAESQVTGANITSPVCSMLLAYATTQGSEVSAAGYAVPDLQCHWNLPFPILLKGPCSVIACWGGTKAVLGIASYCYAEVPISRFA